MRRKYNYLWLWMALSLMGGQQPMQASSYDRPFLSGLQLELMKSGEWPLPRIAPFPIGDILGQWELEPGAGIVIRIDYVGVDPFERHKVEVKIYDISSGLQVGRGPGLVANNVLRAERIQYADQYLYLEMASLVPPKDSFEDKNKERMVFVYLESRENSRQKVSLRVKKIQTLD